jgi:hypothetical protein
MGSIGENELFFILQGLKWTVLLAIIGFVGGGVFGILIALARTSKNRFAKYSEEGGDYVENMDRDEFEKPCMEARGYKQVWTRN